MKLWDFIARVDNNVSGFLQTNYAAAAVVSFVSALVDVKSFPREAAQFFLSSGLNDSPRAWPILILPPQGPSWPFRDARAADASSALAKSTKR